PGAAPVFAGLGQAELMAARYDAAERRSLLVSDLVSAPEMDPLAWAMACRVRGVVRSHLGDPESGVALCREAFAVAPTAHARGLAVLYFCNVLLDAGRNQEAINVALDAVAQGYRAGLDRT